MRIVMRATKDPRTRSTRQSFVSGKESREGTRGRRQVSSRFYRAPRELCSISPPITIKRLFRDIFSRSDDPLFQQASQHAIPARYAVMCTRPSTAQGGWIEWKLRGLSRCWILLMLLGPSAVLTIVRRPDTRTTSLGPNTVHRNAVGLRITRPSRLVYHHFPWWSCWLSQAPLYKQTVRLISNRITSC